MPQMSYDKQITALLVIDPFNFISEGGKVWDRLKAVAEANGCKCRRRLARRQPAAPTDHAAPASDRF